MLNMMVSFIQLLITRTATYCQNSVYGQTLQTDIQTDIHYKTTTVTLAANGHGGLINYYNAEVINATSLPLYILTMAMHTHTIMGR